MTQRNMDDINGSKELSQKIFYPCPIEKVLQIVSAEVSVGKEEDLIPDVSTVYNDWVSF